MKKVKKPAPVPAIVPGPKALRIAHWTITNGSGMHRVAESLAKAETALGLDSVLVDPTLPETWKDVEDADVHVCHTHIPTEIEARATRPYRRVWVGHGTPDHVFENTIEEVARGAYGHGDGVMLMQYWLREADAKVTFWPRHKSIYDRMLTRGARKTDCIPLGVDLDFWKAGATSEGKFAGIPSVFTCENPHRIKWPYDLFNAWPDITDVLPAARLHATYVARDMHRAVFPWINANGTAFTSYISPAVYQWEWLRNAFRSTDFFCGLVRYGDLNHLSQQANAAGAKTISYTGNPHSDYWIAEGSHTEMAKELLEIFKGDRAPRLKEQVPDISATAQAMADVYRSIL